MILWVVYGAVLAAAAFVPLVAGPDEPSTEHATASLTMTFVVMGLGTVFNALTNRRDPASGLTPPILTAVGVGRRAGRADLPRDAASEPPDTGCSPRRSPVRSGSPRIGLALALPLVIEVGKWFRRRRAAQPDDARRRSGR